MAKSGLMGGGGGGRVPTSPGTFAPTTSPRPVAPGQPQPGGGPMQMPPMAANPGSMFRRGEGGILPERGSREQLDMVQALLQSGMQSAQGSGSPLLAFLAPMAGGAIGSRTSSLYDQAQEGAVADSYDQFSQMTGASPEAIELLRMMEDPNLPSAAKSQLAKIYEAMTEGGSQAPSRGRASGGGGRTSSGSSAPSGGSTQKERLYGNYEIDGVLHGRDRYGQLVPYKNEDGRPIRADEDGYTPVPLPESPLIDTMIEGPSMGPPPTADAAPRLSGNVNDMSDEDLIRKYAG